MLAEDGLVVADAYLDRARLHLDRVDPTLTTPPAAGDEALDGFSAPQRLRPASGGLERAGTFGHGERVARRVRAEQWGRRPASSPAGAIGVPR